jgi:hypothetical protein
MSFKVAAVRERKHTKLCSLPRNMSDPQVVGKRTSAGQQIGSQHHTAPLFAFLFRFYEDHLWLPVEYGTRVYGKDEGHISGFIRGAKEVAFGCCIGSELGDRLARDVSMGRSPSRDSLHTG